MAVCPCDIHEFPLPPDIPPGLARVPRQIGLFGDFRAAMLGDVRRHAALRDWRARDADDFGLMLLEWWAYVADVLAFYGAEHAQDLFLGTARDPERVRALVGLIGYRPRPALAAEAVLAALVDGVEPVTAPAGTRFIADAVAGAPPQEFELAATTGLDPLRNGWTLAPVPTSAYDPARLLVDPATRNLSEGGLFVIEVGSGAGAARAALRVGGLAPEPALDGASYLRLTPSGPGVPPPGPATLADVRLWAFTQTAPVSGGSGTTLTLDGLLPQLRQGEMVVVEGMDAEAPLAPEVAFAQSVSFDTATIGGGSGGGDFARQTAGGGAFASRTTGGFEFDEPIATPSAESEPPIRTAVTRVTLSAATSVPAKRARLHFGRVRGGRLIAPPKSVIEGGDLAGGRPFLGRHDPPALEGSGELLLKGARDRGARVAGSAIIDAATGEGRFAPSGGYEPFEGELRTPVVAHGNVLQVTRGRTVEEVLGSGAGSASPFQSFTLAKSPLTYLSDPSAPGGRRSTLRLWIDGVEWREVESLFLAGPTERVFTVTLDADGRATVTTGGEGFGLPAPLGVRNVFALYRFGAGEPPPGANQIRQVAGPVPRLRRVFNPTPAFGGGPGDLPEDMRFTAPAAAATFDRAVSAADYAALARGWGALAATAAVEWVPRRLREGVAVTAVFEGEATPEALAGLEAHLVARGAEGVPVRVAAATPVTGALALTAEAADGAAPEAVKAALETIFLHPFTGILGPRRAAVGGPVFRSALLGAALKAEGIGAILSLLWNGAPAPARFSIGPGEYFAPTLTVSVGSAS